MKTLLDVLGISVVEITPDHVELTMPISGDVLQEWGFLHGGRKQFWRIVAYDETGDVLSEGTMLTMISPLSRLAEKGIEAPEISYTGPCQDRPVVHGDGK